MKDLEKFIGKNKEAFNDEGPSEGLWDKIEQELEQKKEVRMVPLRRVWQVAAAVAVIAVCIGALALQAGSKKAAVAKNAGMSDVERYYSAQVSDKMQRLSTFEIDEELLEEIDFLKQEFDNLKEESETEVNRNELIEAMVDNYKIRIQILENVLMELENKKDNEKTVTQ